MLPIGGGHRHLSFVVGIGRGSIMNSSACGSSRSVPTVASTSVARSPRSVLAGDSHRAGAVIDAYTAMARTRPESLVRHDSPRHSLSRRLPSWRSARCWSGVTEVETPRDRSDRSPAQAGAQRRHPAGGSGSGEPAAPDLPSVGPTNWAGGWWRLAGGLPSRFMRVELSTELIVRESAAAPEDAGNDAAGVQHRQSPQSGRRSPHDM
jgi:hypothetical protein